MSDETSSPLSTAFGLLMDTAHLGLEQIKRYLRFVANRARQVVVALVVLGVPVAICGLLKVPANWLYSGYLILLTIGALYLFLLAMPLFVASQIVVNRFPELKESLFSTARVAGDIGFWGCMLAIYFHIVPVWNNPSSVLLLLLVICALALASITGRVAFNPQRMQTFRTVQLVGMFLLVTCSISFPDATRRVLRSKSSLEKWPLEALSAKPIAVTRFQDLELFNRHTGKPQVWLDTAANGDLSFYDDEGFNPHTGKAYQLIQSPQDIQSISNWFGLSERQQTAKTDMAKRRVPEEEFVVPPFGSFVRKTSWPMKGMNLDLFGDNLTKADLVNRDYYEDPETRPRTEWKSSVNQPIKVRIKYEFWEGDSDRTTGPERVRFAPGEELVRTIPNGWSLKAKPEEVLPPGTLVIASVISSGGSGTSFKKVVLKSRATHPMVVILEWFD